jgi:hypothetical protein
MGNNDQYYLKVYTDKSELVGTSGSEVFIEGDMTDEAKGRYREIQDQLENGYLRELIESLLENAETGSVYHLEDYPKMIITKMVDSITSEVGRAIVGLSVMQLVVKSISPEQSIRLHKGGGGVRNFSWTEGVSMRSLDKRYITPMLRKYDLIRLNADGFMMTRSLAENYPYSKVYKANLRGAREEWLELVELIESGKIDSLEALKYLLSLLINRADHFNKMANSTLEVLKTVVGSGLNKKKVENFINTHITQSDYAARLMEVSMHSLMQALYELKVFVGGELKPLSQMRSANKKHGNVGDIEILVDSEIIESWDAKFGKSYLRDEIEELAEKLKKHESVKIAGFVTDSAPERLDEIGRRISEIEELHGVRILIREYQTWVDEQYERAIQEVNATEEEISQTWITAYVESIAQKRRDIAPIDEPCQSWLEGLNNLLQS